MSDTEFFADVADGFRATAERPRIAGAEASEVLLMGHFDDVLVILLELRPTSYPGIVFGLARYKSQLRPMTENEGPWEIGRNLAEANVWERGISFVHIRELNADFIHWNRSDRGVRDRVPHRPEEIQGFRWPKEFERL
ncbi:hypothetical protein [Dietzia sp. PP-33]|mgnify:CR=1 FL=1|jgi:hypothetical protein|uniref:hypothetical protein n=1 Tax=Dietzia sp. PP-33 TaxID=2957500 RepID=UPI0029BCF402|nr:hypothetical protein [Dietzia sp. PP-33]MDX2358368.1 hypothetical protein [Dietzia sp. PP-33]